MSDTEETSKAKLGVKDLLINNPLTAKSNEPESTTDEITTNSIENSSRVINDKPDDFDNEAIQEQMNDLIHDLQSDSITPDNKNFSSKKIITTGRLNDPEDNTSTPAIVDSTSDIIPQGPRRSISESALNNNKTTEQLSTLPVQQDENSTVEEEETSNETIGLPVSSRKQSVASKKSGLSNEKPNNDPDREMANISRRSSTTKSPLNQLQSPTPSDSHQNEKPKSRTFSASRPASTTKSQTDGNTFSSTNDQLKLIKSGEQLQIPTNDLGNEQTNSPPPSPSIKDLVTTNPLLTNNSRPASTHSKEKVQDGDAILSKSQTSRRSSKDSDAPIRTSAKQRSGQHSKKNSADRTILSPLKVNSAKSEQKLQRRSSATDSKSSSRSITPTNEKQANRWVEQAPVPALQTTDDDTHASRPQSPNVEQIAEHNQLSSTKKKRSNDEQKKSTRRTNSSDSSNRIRLVDEKSLDSNSDNDTENEQSKPRRTKSKKKDEETNTNPRSGNQQQQESTSRKPSKTSKSMTEHSPSIRRRIHLKEQTSAATPDTEPDTDVSNVRHLVKKSKENDQTNQRQALSDTEQVLGEKQKKRRRPKRISRTTQTYECVFRRMEFDQHDELRPKIGTEKNIQTRKSQLRPTTRSPKKHYPVYISADEFKLEEILPKNSPQNSRNPTRTSLTTQTNPSQPSKLLILRPTLPIQHAESTNVQRISLHYNIDLVSKENKSTTSTPDLRNKTQATTKQTDEKSNLPTLRSSTSTANTPTNKFIPKDKTVSNRKEEKSQQRKTGGTV